MTVFVELCAQRVFLLPKSHSDFQERTESVRVAFFSSMGKRKGCHVGCHSVLVPPDFYVANASTSLDSVFEMATSKKTEKYYNLPSSTFGCRDSWFFSEFVWNRFSY